MEYLWVWLAMAATREDAPNAKNCIKFMNLVQTEFWEGCLAEEITWQNFILIPKGTGELLGIGLVDLLWKTVTFILN